MATKKEGRVIQPEEMHEAEDTNGGAHRAPGSVPSIPDSPDEGQLEKDKEEQKRFKDFQKNEKSKK